MNLCISGVPFVARSDIETLHYMLAEHASMCWQLYQPVGRVETFFVHILERLENPLLKPLLFSIYCLPRTNLIDFFWKQQKITQKMYSK